MSYKPREGKRTDIENIYGTIFDLFLTDAYSKTVKKITRDRSTDQIAVAD